VQRPHCVLLQQAAFSDLHHNLSMKTLSLRLINSICVLAILYYTFRQTTIFVIDRHMIHYDNNYDYANEDPQERKKQQSFPFQQELEKRNLQLSLRQQQKFHMNKDLVSENFPQEMLYSLDWNVWHMFLLNNQFAFCHIFKNGGTTVEKQTGFRQVRNTRVGNRTVMTVLRDPIEHFLSGWQECGERFPFYMEMGKRSDKAYDGRIQKWLERTKALARGGAKSCRKSMECICALHSLPQANFLITDDKRIGSKIRLVGDLQELPDLLELAGVQYNRSIAIGKNALLSTHKQNYFPRKAHLIANDTMRSVCEFLSLDYFLFDFELPEPCRTKDLL
jgi:hypothetical protein